MKEFILGDCNEVLKSIPDKSINLFLEDMPYNTTACHWEYEVDLEQYWALRLPKLAENGCFVLTASQPFTTDLIMSNRKMFKYEWIWDKGTHSNPYVAKYQPLSVHENICAFYQNNSIYNPIKTHKPKQHQRPNSRGIYHKTKEYSEGVFGKRKSNYAKDYNGEENYPNTIIKVFKKPQSGTLHPTQKPVDLFRYLIRTYTNKGDTVFDGYAGSGTTAIACEMEDRNYTCVEQDKDYFDSAKKRLNNHKAQLSIFT